METKLAILAVALFAVFIAIRVMAARKTNKTLNAAMKKWRKDTDGG